MSLVTPSSADELALLLKDSAERRRTISVIGGGTKNLMGGPVVPADLIIQTLRLNRVREYEPNDLTISVESGHSFAKLQDFVGRESQMIALDPPFGSGATIGGIIASNSSGPMRRAFGTARDLVIGMQFAMLNGKLANVGGMVVKNVAGLDLGKLMIGSFGTLAVMTSINLRLHAIPEETQTFLYSFPDLDRALEKRDSIIRSPLRPLALELISPAAAGRFGATSFLLALRAGGSKLVLRRYERELSRSEKLTGADDMTWWAVLREFTADFLKHESQGLVLRIGTTLSDMSSLLRNIPGSFISRAASGVTYVYLTSWQTVSNVWRLAVKNKWSATVEFASDENRTGRELWLLRQVGKSDSSFAMMKKIKQMFDPNNLLNRSRLYGRL